MSRFDFTGYVNQRNEAIRRQEKAERDRQHETRNTWVELIREIGNYVHRNGKRCQVSGNFPLINLDNGKGSTLVVTVEDRARFALAYTGSEPQGYFDTGNTTQEASGDPAVMRAIVDWYEANAKP